MPTLNYSWIHSFLFAFFLSPRGGRSAQPKPVNIFENLYYRCRIFFRFLFNYSAFLNSYRGFERDPCFILAKQNDLASGTREGLKSNQTFFKNWGRPVATQLLNSQRFPRSYKGDVILSSLKMHCLSIENR